MLLSPHLRYSTSSPLGLRVPGPCLVKAEEIWWVGLSTFWCHLPLPYTSPSESGCCSHWSTFSRQLHQTGWWGGWRFLLSLLSPPSSLPLPHLSHPHLPLPYPQVLFTFALIFEVLIIIASTTFACLGRQFNQNISGAR